jgi:hypothetical protein
MDFINAWRQFGVELPAPRTCTPRRRTTTGSRASCAPGAMAATTCNFALEPQTSTLASSITSSCHNNNPPPGSNVGHADSAGLGVRLVLVTSICASNAWAVERPAFVATAQRQQLSLKDLNLVVSSSLIILCYGSFVGLGLPVSKYKPVLFHASCIARSSE